MYQLPASTTKFILYKTIEYWIHCLLFSFLLLIVDKNCTFNWPFKWHQIIQNSNVTLDGLIHLLSWVLLWWRQHSLYHYRIYNKILKPDRVLQPELNSLHLWKFFLIWIYRIVKIFNSVWTFYTWHHNDFSMSFLFDGCIIASIKSYVNNSEQVQN